MIAFVIAIWGLQWHLLIAGAAVAAVALMGVTLAAMSTGTRFASSIPGAMYLAAWLLSFPLRPLLFLQRLSPATLKSSASSPDQSLEFAFRVDTSDEPLDEHEVRMIRGVVQLDQTVAREIMVPRVDIVAVESTTTLAELAEVMNSAGHSRIPVYDVDVDHIQGVAHARDVLQELAAERSPAEVTAQEVSREPLFIPESKNLEELLDEFQELRVHLAVVVDEYGGVSGIVTIEDLLEEIVGEIHDEFDSGEPVIQAISDSEFIVDARLQLDDLNESIGVNVVGDGFDTIGGFVFEQLGKIPVPGDTVRYDGLSIEVVDTVGRRPKNLRVRRL